MPGSQTTPGRQDARLRNSRYCLPLLNGVGTQDSNSIVAQWLACTLPYRRFADVLTNACARLGADVDRYSFIVVDLHHQLLAGLPAHSTSFPYWPQHTSLLTNREDLPLYSLNRSGLSRSIRDWPLTRNEQLSAQQQ
jgi:hypothetical protein